MDNVHYLWFGGTFLVCMAALVITLVRLNKCDIADKGGRIKHTVILTAVLIAACQPWLGPKADGIGTTVLAAALLMSLVDGLMPYSEYKDAWEAKETEFYTGDLSTLDVFSPWYIRVWNTIKGLFR